MPSKSPPFLRLYQNTIKTEDGCWEWQGETSSSGYGQIKAFGRMVSCHRLSYELYNGPVPEGMEIAHHCDNRICVNPDHLEAMTHKANMDDMIEKGRKRKGTPNPRRGIRSTQAKPVAVLGKNYGSIKEAERAIGVSSGTVYYWLKHCPDKAKLITREEFSNG